jgi:hypothetical protein
MQWQELPALVAHFRRKLATMTRLGVCDLTPFLLKVFFLLPVSSFRAVEIGAEAGSTKCRAASLRETGVHDM